MATLSEQGTQSRTEIGNIHTFFLVRLEQERARQVNYINHLHTCGNMGSTWAAHPSFALSLSSSQWHSHVLL